MANSTNLNHGYLLPHVDSLEPTKRNGLNTIRLLLRRTYALGPKVHSRPNAHEQMKAIFQLQTFKDMPGFEPSTLRLLTSN